MAGVEYSDTFSSKDAEIIYESCDGIRFRIHSVYLRAHTGVLAPPVGSFLEGVVHLTEPSTVLEVLFRFIYPAPPPELDTWPNSKLGLITEVAEAAEKYQVFPAMYASIIEMEDRCASSPIAILAHALRHDYKALANKAAVYALDASSLDITKEIPGEFHDAWLSYYGQWISIRKKIIFEHGPRLKVDPKVLSAISSSFRSLLTSNSTVNNVQLSKVIAEEIASISPLINLEGQSDELSSPLDLPVEPEPGSSQDTVHVLPSDGKGFSVNRYTLTSCAPGFHDYIKDTPTGCLDLPESSSTVDLLLQFLQGKMVPELVKLPFLKLQEVAYMAEKFKFYQAMNICRISMKKRLPIHFTDVFYYAATFGYKNLLNDAAPLMMEHHGDSYSNVLDRIPRDVGIAWAKYCHYWQTVRQTGYRIALEEFDVPGACDCENKPNFILTHTYPLMKRINAAPRMIEDLPALFRDAASCPVSQTRKMTAIYRITRAVPRLGPFSSLIPSDPS